MSTLAVIETASEICSECGQVSFLPIETETGYCPQCDRNYFECEHCGDVLPVESCWSGPDTATSFRPLCVSCGENLGVCEDCGEEYFSDEDTHLETENGTVCESCAENYTECARCGRATHRDRVLYFPDDEDCESPYCDSCFHRVAETCSECGTVYDTRNHSECPIGCCLDDDDDDDHGRSPIEEYSCKPSWDRQGRGPFFAGAEIEVVHPTGADLYSCAQSVRDKGAEHIATVKRDGSLPSGRSFEVVTHPLSLSRWASSPVKSAADFLRAHGFRSHQTDCCGLHVHVSRPSGILALVRIASFVYANQTTLETLGRRSFGSYCKGKHLKNNRQNIVEDGDRYSAVNFCNFRTVEYRFPRGTLRWETILATVTLAVAITRFCSADTYSVAQYDGRGGIWRAFVAYVRDAARKGIEDERPAFAALETYMTAKGAC